MRARRRLCLLYGALLALLSSASIAAPLRALFLGNSHTATNDLPRVVAALAAQRGIEIDTTMLAEPGYSLADHLAGPRLRRMLQQEWDWVVLQQGPSSLPESRRDLVASTQAIAQLLRARTGAETRNGAAAAPRLVLISIWPQRRYRASSLAAEASYRAAAAAVEGCVFPAATAWRLAQQSGNAPRLYQTDQMHARRAGTVLMALTVLPGLIGEARSGLEARVGDTDSAESDAVRALQAAAWQAHRDEPQRCRTP